MGECGRIKVCDFYNDRLRFKPLTADILKFKYCAKGDPECARLRALGAIGAENVPFHLYPDQKQKADILIMLASISRH